MISPNVKGKMVQYLAASCAGLTLMSAGVVYGWINPILDRLLSSDSPCPMTFIQASWVATLPELGTLLSTIPGGFLADAIGRKTLLLCATPMTLVGWILIYYTSNVYLLMFARTLQGMAVGFTSTVFPLYLSEIAEPSVRGSLGNFFVLAFALGQVYVYAVGPFVDYRKLAVLGTIPSWLFFITFVWFRKSPYFLLMAGQPEKARVSLMVFRGGVADEEFERIKRAVEEEKARKDTWKVAYNTAVGRKALFITSIIAITVFMGGFTVILSYSSNIFFKTTNMKITSDMFTLAMGLMLCMAALLGSVMLDLWGRRPTMLLSHWGNTFCLLSTALYYNLLHSGFDIYYLYMVPIVAILLSSVLSLFGICAIKVYQSELFPTASRGFATGVNTFICGLVSSVTIFMYLPIENTGLVHVSYYIFAMFSFGGAVFIRYTAPETKGRTFEEIQEDLQARRL